MKFFQLPIFLLALLLTGFGCVFTAEAPIETTAPVTIEVTEEQPPMFKNAEAEELHGDWETVLGAPWESMSIYEDGAYSTFLHDRPFEYGDWSLTDGGIQFESANGDSYSFPAVVFEEGMLIMDQSPEGDEYWVFTPIK